MSRPDDFPDDMEAFPFDERDGDAVFGAPGADVPESLDDVADLVQAARRAGSADELVGGDEVVAAIAAAIGEHAAPLPRGADERIRVINRSRTAKLAAGATAVLMLGATAAAAATGTLPTPIAHHHAELTSEDIPTGPSGATGVTGHHGHHHGVSGTVASVNGSTDPAACGAGDTGTFTLTGHHDETFTVDVAPSTTYSSKHVTDASFANVCVGARVKVKGTVDGTTVAADKVRIKHSETPDEHGPVHPDLPVQAQEHHHVHGSVASVNGSADPAACGSGDTGSFTVTDRDGNSFTVNVVSTTRFLGHHDDSGAPTFADVCVGTRVGAKGDETDTTVTADKVFVLGDHKGDEQGGHHADGEADHEADHEVEKPEVEQPEVEQPEVEQPEVEQPEVEHHQSSAEHHDDSSHGDNGGTDGSGHD
jgi:hypothetical protein